ncbi:MAG: hypothetical protein GXP25_02655 [Planctomycetes bacterium]|nr:hypothetical protein [Planctomycetota bacterium]
MRDKTPDNPNPEPEPEKEPVEVYPGVKRYQFFSKAKHRMLTPHLNRIAMLIIAVSLLGVIVKALIMGSGYSLFCLEDRACVRVTKTDDPAKRCPEMLEPVELVIASRVNDYIRFIKNGGLRCQGCGRCREFCILNLDIPEIVDGMQKRTLTAMERGKIPLDVLERAFYDPGLSRNQTREEAANKEIFDRVQAYLARTSGGVALTEEEHRLNQCARCHEGADRSILTEKRFVHFDYSDLPPEERTTMMVRVIRWVYLLLIAGVIGGMLGHNILDFAKTIRRPKTADEGAMVDRYGLVWRLQHGVLLVVFITLGLSGLSMLFHAHWPAPVVVRLFGGVDWAGFLHIGCGFSLIAIALVHVGSFIFSKRFRRDMKGIFPRFRDVADAVHQVLFYLGLRKEGARFGRFGYREKAEYWAVVWGTVIMGASGFILFLARSGAALPEWLVLAARAVHGYEAILAVLAILVWHMYNVHLSPRRFPGSATWITGKIGIDEMKEDHPLDQEERGSS